MALHTRHIQLYRDFRFWAMLCAIGLCCFACADAMCLFLPISNMEDECLVESVKKYDFLYNTSAAAYHNADKREAAWRKVSEETRNIDQQEQRPRHCRPNCLTVYKLH